MLKPKRPAFEGIWYYLESRASLGKFLRVIRGGDTIPPLPTRPTKGEGADGKVD